MLEETNQRSWGKMSRSLSFTHNYRFFSLTYKGCTELRQISFDVFLNKPLINPAWLHKRFMHCLRVHYEDEV